MRYIPPGPSPLAIVNAICAFLIIGGIIFIFAVVAVTNIADAMHPTKPSPDPFYDPSMPPERGMEGHLGSGADGVICPPSFVDFHKLNVAQANDDKVEVQRIRSRSYVIHQGYEVKNLDSEGLTGTEMRIQFLNGPLQGKACWINAYNDKVFG